MSKNQSHFLMILSRALRVGEAAARLAHERGQVSSSDRIGYSFVYLPKGAAFTEWALANDHASEGFIPGQDPILYTQTPEGLPTERPEIEAAQALAIQRSLINSGILGVTVEDFIETEAA